MPTLKFLHILEILIPAVDKLQPEHAGIQVIIAKHIGAETCFYA